MYFLTDCSQCDESKPCGNCIGFGIPCDLAPGTARIELGYRTATVTRRGRGRPRKIWAAADTPPTSASPPSKTTPAPVSLDADADNARIDVDNAELLLHFVTRTAETIAGDNLDVQKFWRRNAACIGLSHTHVLHLIFALAALHLAFQAQSSDADEIINNYTPLSARKSGDQYRSLAQKHLTAGLSGFSAELSRAGPENCGALYLGAVLTSYCTFASGPASANDLLICTADGDDTQDTGLDISTASLSWMPFVYGVRLMRQSFSPDQLFAGPMQAFKPGAPPEPLQKPVCARDRFRFLDWEKALDGLRMLIAGAPPAENDEGFTTTSSQSLHPDPDKDSARTAICLEALDDLIGIYVATYGRRDSEGETTHGVPAEQQFVFGWLYRIGREFVACARRREPLALLVLAHYAVLLNLEVIPDGWYIDGWRKHIIARVADLIVDDKYREWVQWPIEQLALETRRECDSNSIVVGLR